jgi:hypothetical protein
LFAAQEERMAVRHPVRSAGLVAAALCSLAVGLALPAQADPGNGQGNTNSSSDDGHNPPGNNGTVFIHDVAGDEHPHNVPHVSCTFYADFFGFDKNQQVTVSFTGQAPTGAGTQLGGTWGPDVISTTDAGGAGSDFDHELQFTADELGVSALGAPAAQGYHVRMTVATGEPGGKKTKVFWIEPCTSTQSAAAAQGASTENGATQNGATQNSAAQNAAAATSAPTQGNDESSPSTGPAENAAAAVLGESLTATAATATAAATGATTPAAASAAPTRVLGERITRNNAAQVLGARLSRATSLPFTGAAGVLMMSLLGLLMVAGGVLATTAARRRRSTA